MRAARILTTGASMVLVPVRMAGAVLDAPRAARNHPRSRELRRLLDEGYTVTSFRRQDRPASAHVTLQRGDDTREVTSTDLAFVAYAARIVPRTVARAAGEHQHHVLHPN